MSISDKDMAAGLRTRKKQAIIDADVRATIAGHMHTDALRIPIDAIRPSPFQSRKISDSTVEDMMASITGTDGIISPIIVRPIGENEYELVSGHTRHLACKRLGYTDIPAVVKPMKDADAAKALTTDNVARTDLTDYELFLHIQMLINNGFVRSNSETARLLCKDRADIIRIRSYANLPEAVLEIMDVERNLLGRGAVHTIVGKNYPSERVIEGVRKLIEGQLKSQQALLTWLERHEQPTRERAEHRILNEAGKTVGSVVRSGHSVRIVAKGVNLDELEVAMRSELARQGFRF